MGTVADKIQVVCVNTRLQRSMASAVRPVKPSFYSLHATANEERRFVVYRDDATVHDEWEAKLLEAASD